MVEFSISGGKFDEIEEIDIPEDIDSMSSDTEGISDDQTQSKPMLKNATASLDLQKWLETDDMLEFSFDQDLYNNSLSDSDDFSKMYAKFVTKLYKTIESLSEDEFLKIDQQFGTPPIGLISSSLDVGVNANREYRSSKINQAFSDFLKYLEDLSHSISDDNENTDRLYHLTCILRCLEASYFSPNEKLVPELLASWVNSYDPKPHNDMVEAIMINTPKPYLHPQFWNTYMAQLICRGLFSQAVDAIDHSEYQDLDNESITMHSVISDLKTLLSNYSSMALKNQFKQWKLSACEFRDMFPQFKSEISDSRYLNMINQIHDLTLIITGLPKTISSYSENWYEIYVALSLYQVRDDPNLYKDYFEIAVKEKPPTVVDEDEEDWFLFSERCFVDIIEGNLLKVLKSIYSCDPATASYVSKIFEMKGLLSDYYPQPRKVEDLKQFKAKKTISEYFWVTHAFSCLNTHDLVPVGIGLLLNKEVTGSEKSRKYYENVVADFLPNYRYKTNDDLEWGLTICAKLNLVATAKKLYYKYGLESLENGLLYESLNMLANCFDPDSLEPGEDRESIKKIHYIIWDLIFQDSLLNNRPIKDELINNIVKHEVSFEVHPVIKQCLSPYAVLVEFFNSMSKSEDHKAMEKLSRLLHLLRFNHLPKKFFPLLLSQLIPFIVNEKYTFELPELIVIIEVIDNYEQSIKESGFEDSDELYVYCINNYEADLTSYDWRSVLKGLEISLPQGVFELLKFIRNEIAAKVGKVFIDGKTSI